MKLFDRLKELSPDAWATFPRMTQSSLKELQDAILRMQRQINCIPQHMRTCDENEQKEVWDIASTWVSSCLSNANDTPTHVYDLMSEFNHASFWSEYFEEGLPDVAPLQFARALKLGVYGLPECYAGLLFALLKKGVSVECLGHSGILHDFFDFHVDDVAEIQKAYACFYALGQEHPADIGLIMQEFMHLIHQSKPAESTLGLSFSGEINAAATAMPITEPDILSNLAYYDKIKTQYQYFSLHVLWNAFSQDGRPDSPCHRLFSQMTVIELLKMLPDILHYGDELSDRQNLLNRMRSYLTPETQHALRADGEMTWDRLLLSGTKFHDLNEDERTTLKDSLTEHTMHYLLCLYMDQCDVKDYKMTLDEVLFNGFVKNPTLEETQEVLFEYLQSIAQGPLWFNRRDTWRTLVCDFNELLRSSLSGVWDTDKYTTIKDAYLAGCRVRGLLSRLTQTPLVDMEDDDYTDDPTDIGCGLYFPEEIGELQGYIINELWKDNPSHRVGDILQVMYCNDHEEYQEQLKQYTLCMTLLQIRNPGLQDILLLELREKYPRWLFSRVGEYSVIEYLDDDEGDFYEYLIQSVCDHEGALIREEWRRRFSSCTKNHLITREEYLALSDFIKEEKLWISLISQCSKSRTLLPRDNPDNLFYPFNFHINYINRLNIVLLVYYINEPNFVNINELVQCITGGNLDYFTAECLEICRHNTGALSNYLGKLPTALMDFFRTNLEYWVDAKHPMDGAVIEWAIKYIDISLFKDWFPLFEESFSPSLIALLKNNTDFEWFDYWYGLSCNQQIVLPYLWPYYSQYDRKNLLQKTGVWEAILQAPGDTLTLFSDEMLQQWLFSKKVKPDDHYSLLLNLRKSLGEERVQSLCHQWLQSLGYHGTLENMLLDCVNGVFYLEPYQLSILIMFLPTPMFPILISTPEHAKDTARRHFILNTQLTALVMSTCERVFSEEKWVALITFYLEYLDHLLEDDHQTMQLYHPAITRLLEYCIDNGSLRQNVLTRSHHFMNMFAKVAYSKGRPIIINHLTEDLESSMGEIDVKCNIDLRRALPAYPETKIITLLNSLPDTQVAFDSNSDGSPRFLRRNQWLTSPQVTLSMITFNQHLAQLQAAMSTLSERDKRYANTVVRQLHHAKTQYLKEADRTLFVIQSQAILREAMPKLLHDQHWHRLLTALSVVLSALSIGLVNRMTGRNRYCLFARPAGMALISLNEQLLEMRIK